MSQQPSTVPASQNDCCPRGMCSKRCENAAATAPNDSNSEEVTAQLLNDLLQGHWTNRKHRKNRKNHKNHKNQDDCQDSDENGDDSGDNSSGNNSSGDDNESEVNQSVGNNDGNNNSDDSEMTLDQSLELIQGMLSIMSIRLKSASEVPIVTTLQNYFYNHRYTELLAFSRILQCHFDTVDATLSDAFSQMTDLLDPMVVEMGLKESPDFLDHSLRGVLMYFKWCFKDNKLSNSQDINDSLYDTFMNALREGKYYKLYGMLLTCQELFQQPDKNVVFDIIHEHIVSLCPDLD